MESSDLGLGVAKQSSAEKLSDFTCRISTKLDDNAEHNYWNNSFWVKYPRGIVEQAGGKMRAVALVFKSNSKAGNSGTFLGNDNVLRVAQCLMPDSPAAEVMLKKILSEFGPSTWMASNGARADASIDDVSGPNKIDEWICLYEWWTRSCYYNATTGQYYNCIDLFDKCVYWTYQHEDQGSQGSGGGSQEPGACATMPDPTLLCMDDGMGGANDLDICDGFDPPVYCSNPCDTELADGLLNHIKIMLNMEAIWLASGYGTYSLMENGAFLGVDPNTGEPFWLPVKTGTSGMLSLQTACELRFKSVNQETRDAIQAMGIKYFVHTHPFSHGQRQEACGRPDLTYISKHVSRADRKASARLGIPGIYMDANGIVLYDQSGFIAHIPPCAFKHVNKEISS